jgi:hypothetical protein
MGNAFQSAIRQKPGVDINSPVPFFAIVAGSGVSSCLRVFVVNRGFLLHRLRDPRTCSRMLSLRMINLVPA